MDLQMIQRLLTLNTNPKNTSYSDNAKTKPSITSQSSNPEYRTPNLTGSVLEQWIKKIWNIRHWKSCGSIYNLYDGGRWVYSPSRVWPCKPMLWPVTPSSHGYWSQIPKTQIWNIDCQRFQSTHILNTDLQIYLDSTSLSKQILIEFKEFTF